MNKLLSAIMLYLSCDVLIILERAAAETLPVSAPERLSEASFNYKGVSYRIVLNQQSSGRVSDGALSCANPHAKAELATKCALTLEQGGQVLTTLDLGERVFIYSKGKWTSAGRDPIQLFSSQSHAPLVAIVDYGSCEGKLYTLFWLDEASQMPQLKPVTLNPEGFDANTIFAESISLKDLAPTKDDHREPHQVYAEGYDNALLFHYLRQYTVNFETGEMKLIGLASNAAGTFEAVKQLVNKRRSHR